MATMKSDTPLDYALFQLSPKRSRCVLFVSSDGSTEKLASGLLKPFVAHLKVAEEQVSSAAQSVNLQVGRHENAGAWFTKGTLERFVRFVSTPEVLELVNTYDAEMSQLEAARRIYSQGAGDQLSGGGASGVTAAEDATKKELLRAIDVRLIAVQQDLSTSCARAAAAGFDIDSVAELQIFAERFGAHRLNEACCKFISLCERRADFINPWKSGPGDRAVRSSYESDMSIDDDPPSLSPCPESVSCQQSNPSSIAFPLRHISSISRESSVERDLDKKPADDVPEKNCQNETSKTTESITVSQPGRRLSVQDRISMFESKQKENTGSKPVGTKSIELRRISSDASAAEKAVLRRWSGASDMSIDLSAEKKDVESPMCTPSFAVVTQDKIILNSNDNDNKRKVSSIVKPEMKIIPSLSKASSDGGLKDGSFNKPEKFLESNKSNSNLVSGETDSLKDQGKTQLKSFINRFENHDDAEEKSKTFPGSKSKGAIGSSDQGKLQSSQRSEELSGSQTQMLADKDHDPSRTQPMPFGCKSDGQVEISNNREDSESRDESGTQLCFGTPRKVVGKSGVFDSVAGSRIREAFAARYKGVEGNSLAAQQEVRSVGENEVAVEKEPRASEEVSSGSVLSTGNYGSQRMKFSRQSSETELSKKAQVQLDERSFGGDKRTPFSGKVETGAQNVFDSYTTPSPEQSQRVRQSKGNQELNDELKMKANELEKLFAEHQMRAPGDQSNSIRKVKPGISHQLPDNYQSAEPESTSSSRNKKKFNAVSLMDTVHSQNSGDVLNRNFFDLSVSEGSRGKFYDWYMQKRDAKLREEWSSNRAQKEARLKSMQDSLERSKSEMRAKLSGSANRHDSISSAHQRAERLRSYSSKSTMKREQEHLDFGDSEDEDEALDYAEQNSLYENRALYDNSIGDDMHRGVQGKKLLTNGRSSLSYTPRTSAAPVPRPASKTSTIASGKRRMQPENPLVQSVPNFSDLKKENTKPSSGGSKAPRIQARNYARNKSTIEDGEMVKEDKSRRSQTLRKSYGNSNEFKEIPSLDSDGVALTPIKFDEEMPKNVGTKPFLKKGSRTGFVSRASNAKKKASLESSAINNVEENDVLVSGPDELMITVKDAVDEQFDTLETENNEILDNEEPKLRQESDNFVNSESENDDVTFSHVDHALGSQLPTECVEPMQDWQGESPITWNSHAQHSFSYSNEMSDVDNSVDSPVGSPASWNSHSLNQMESDAARMRKKWGSAQKPMLAAHLSNNISRKDRTSGFKRLLKFGRKSRGSESLLDWISATTSEGDDDTEDGRDVANRSSEDLRKSRMGFSQAQPSYDSFNDSEFFSESVRSSESSIPALTSNLKLREDHISGSSIKTPRSFFSLSTFRSKGSDSKPR